jgi:hypothetical protein
MNKPVFGLLLGAVLGIFDGLTAWFTPAVRPFLMGIVIGSTFKGLIGGVCAGYLGVGMLLAYGVAAMPSATGEHYYFEIMLPGSILGAVVGYATQKYPRKA